MTRSIVWSIWFQVYDETLSTHSNPSLIYWCSMSHWRYLCSMVITVGFQGRRPQGQHWLLQGTIVINNLTCWSAVSQSVARDCLVSLLRLTCLLSTSRMVHHGSQVGKSEHYIVWVTQQANVMTRNTHKHHVKHLLPSLWRTCQPRLRTTLSVIPH